MASGLFHRQAPTRRAADDDEMPEDSTTTDGTTADPRFTDRTVGADGASRAPGTPIPRHRLAPDQTVPPGGAVAPLDDTTSADTTVPLGRGRSHTGPSPVLAEQDREEALAERDRVDAAEAERVEPVRWARTSFTATLSLILGVCAALAALSGRLAPLAVVVGVVGLVFAALGLAAVSRRHVTGHHVALLGLAFSIAGVVFGILAINKSLPWLDGGADQTARLRDWLDAHVSWLRHM